MWIRSMGDRKNISGRLESSLPMEESQSENHVNPTQIAITINIPKPVISCTSSVITDLPNSP